jgi:hypothetical protein
LIESSVEPSWLRYFLVWRRDVQHDIDEEIHGPRCELNRRCHPERSEGSVGEDCDPSLRSG